MPVSELKTTTGIADLDRVLGGLRTGDNVVWMDDAGSLAWVFAQRFLESSVAKGLPVIYASFDRPIKSLIERLGAVADYPELFILDCFTDGMGQGSPIFSRFYEDERRAGPRVHRITEPGNIDVFNRTLFDLHGGLDREVHLVFESLTGMQKLWGDEDALTSFYLHTCPRLFELNTIAYWTAEKKAHSTRCRALVTHTAQVVIDLSIKRGTTTLKVLKSEGREIPDIKTPHRYWAREGRVTFGTDGRPSSGFNIGLRLKDLRSKRGLSQTELSKQVGVTPSTISQVESGLIFPSLPALLKMAEVLDVGPSSFFSERDVSRRPMIFSLREAQKVRLTAMREDVVQAYRITPLDFEGKYEPYLIEIAPGQSFNDHFFLHKGEELGYLISGVLEIKTLAQTVTVTPDNMIYLTSEHPTGWRNLGDETARLLWLKL